MTRQEIIQEAREWLGVEYKHQASVKGVACDCVGLVRGVFAATGCNVTTEINYSPAWHLYNTEDKLYMEMQKYCIEKPIDEIQPGDILCFGFGRGPSHHVGILTDRGTFIHSYLDIKKVAETRLDETWRKRLRYVFSFPGVGDWQP